MSTSILMAPGELVDLESLHLAKAQDLVRTLQSDRLAFVTYVESRRQPDGTEVVVLDVEVERGQRPIHDIRQVERIAVRFFPSDQRIPETLALRDDFPVVSHLNLPDQERPRSLCLFDEPYDELKLRWTAASLVERLRTWLALTARGELHAPDQPLEPLLLGAEGTLVIPLELLSGSPPRLLVSLVTSSTGHRTYIAALDGGRNGQQTISCVVTAVMGKPQPHGVINRRPQTLYELHNFLERAGVNLLGHMRNHLRQWYQEGGIHSLLSVQLALVVALPKFREAGAAVEATDLYAFISTCPISQIGEQLGVWEMQQGKPGLLLGVDNSRQGETVELVLLNPRMAFSQSQGALFNGQLAASELPIAVVGVGALGSQVVTALARMGYGPWTLIDHDVLLPHNLARHALFGFAVGHAKADVLAHLIGDMLGDSSVAQALTVNVLQPGEQTHQLTEVLAAAGVILDMSASVAAARALTNDYEFPARRLSLFLNPAGTDLVLLAEDTERAISLDLLELQYYRLIAQDDRLAHHLQVNGRPQRIGRSCRDISVTLAQDLVALHAATGSRAVRLAIEHTTAQVSIWQANPASGTITRIDAVPSTSVVQQVEGWTVYADTGLLAHLQEQRQSRLPNETGGVLLGTFDMERKRVSIVDALYSPSDSVEWPTLYIRGCEGLAEQVSAIERRTAGWLSYIGEWHTHPLGIPATPSHADQQVLRWLADARAVEGLPAVMAIVSDSGSQWYIKE
jgi:hypothetical protein